MRRTNPYRFVGWAGIAVLGVAIAFSQQPAATGIYTAAQAEAGRAAYLANCAECHRPDLTGSFEAPPLSGGNFFKRMARAAGPGTGEPHSRHHASRQPGRGRGAGGRHDRRIPSPVERRVGGRANARGCFSNAIWLSGYRTGRRRASSGSGTGSGAPSSPRSRSRPHRHRRSTQLRSRYRRDAAQSSSGRLADDPEELSGLEQYAAHASDAGRTCGTSNLLGSGR